MYDSDSNVVISAPTGSGKTAIMEMAMLRQMQRDPQATRRILYLAPSRALCSERYRDWNSRLVKIYRKAVEITGDNELDETSQSASVVVSTPEKWDSITRRCSEYPKFLDSISLIIVRCSLISVYKRFRLMRSIH